MTQKSYKATGYVATAARTGENYPTAFRGANLFFRGRQDNTYHEVYSGSLNLDEPIPTSVLTGTVSFSPASNVVTGVATEFQSELHLGQMLVTVAGEIITVKEIADDTHFTAYALPLLTGSGVLAYRMPILFELDRARGTLLSGNAFETDRGNILAVGSGVFRKNGQTLNASLTASKRAKIAIYDPDTDTYLIQQLGFATVPVGVTAVATSAPAAKTFGDGDVNTGTDTVNIATHGFNNGQKVLLSNSGGALPVTTPTGEFANAVFIIRVDANNIRFGATLADTVGTPVPVNIASAAGGGTHTVTPISKAMPAGDRSILVAKASTKLGVPSYGNPTEKIKVTLTAGQGIAVSLPAMDSNTDPTDPHDAYRLYGSLHGGSTANATDGADSGAWYYIRTVTAEELGSTAGGTYYLEYLDAEIKGDARLASFDNEVPCDAEFIASVTGYPVLVSCQGKPTPMSKTGTSPGASIVPFKVNNIAAAPLILDTGERAEVPTSPPEIIIGFYLAVGRLYLLTANSLVMAVFTADADFPITTRPFWKTGFSNPYAICFVNGRFYGFTESGATRSAADGEAGSEEHEFAADVEEITRYWDASKVQVKEDPQNECVCYCYGGAFKNADGWWTSLILPFGARNEGWSLPIVISSPDRDMIISGAATVGGHLEFLAGGRNGAGGVDVETYRFDAGLNDGESVSYSIAPQFTDGGDERRPKKVKYPSVRGILSPGATIGLHGAEAGEALTVPDLEFDNTASKTGAIPLSDSEEVVVRPAEQVAVSGLAVYTWNIAGVYDGSRLDDNGKPIKDRIDELTFEEYIQGARR